MINPKYTISPKLLSNITTIHKKVTELNTQRYPTTVLAKLRDEAAVLSAYSSTHIEGNNLPITMVKKILKHLPDNISDTEQEVINYNNALQSLHDQIDNNTFKLNHKTLCEVQKIVTYKSKEISEKQIGNYREDPVWVYNPQTGQAKYLPPDHQDVPKLMDELINFINDNLGKLDPLVLAGVFHQQFVIIHPFADGNGRTARLITTALLAKLGINVFKLFSFENYYNDNISRYFASVGMPGNYYDIYKEWDFTQWLEYFTQGIIDELERTSKELEKETNIEVRLEDFHKQIIEYVREHGRIQDSEYASFTNRSKASRSNDFQKLIELGMLERRGRARSTYYVLKEQT